MEKFLRPLLLFLKGMGMGAADVVPGVSGGTVALISGIYERLLAALNSVDNQAVKLLIKFEIKLFWKHIDGNFLFVLVAGIATSVITLAKIVTYLVEIYPIQLWSFFFGLIVISAIVVLRNVRSWSIGKIVMLLVGIVAAFLITEATPAATPESLWFVFLSGAIAICAMILPGISGSFILLIMGKYEFIFNALNNRDIPVILTFIVGCVVGLLSFARVVTWLFKKYHDQAIALLSGFMIGSLNKVWPWKLPLQFRLNSDGEQVAYMTKNVLPGEYARELGQNPSLFQGLLFIALGIFIIVVIEKIALRLKSA
ncbi:MAG: DUF368 domain-containing protein [Bacteroidota bacterium]